MIHVATTGPQDLGPAYEQWSARADLAREATIAEWKAGKKPTFQREIWKELKDIFLLSIFHYKCAYCESRHVDGFALHAEHIRPKGKITEERKEIDHPGYFWIAYEWWNLVPSCASCNSWHTEEDKKRHPGKANEFRVAQNRVHSPGDDRSAWREELDAEKPLLLNPYCDHPENEIDFEENGFPFPKDGSVRGRETIEVCHLDRHSLIEARREQNDKIMKAINEIMSNREVQTFDAGQPVSLWRRSYGRYQLEKVRKRLNLAS
jgi:hypothetical protein